MALINVYGRKPVLEAVSDPRVRIARVLVDRRARGEPVDSILEAAARRGVPVKRVPAEKVTRLSGNGRHDQGVVAEVEAAGVADLDAWLAELDPESPAAVMVLDGVTNPSNVGMIVRTVAAAGLEGLVLPDRGSPHLGPLVIKASAGTVFAASVLRSPSAEAALEALGAAGFRRLGLRGQDAEPLYECGLPARVALVLGSETAGVSATGAARLDGWASIPLAPGIESLNVASAAAVAAYEVVRRRWALRRAAR